VLQQVYAGAVNTLQELVLALFNDVIYNEDLIKIQPCFMINEFHAANCSSNVDKSFRKYFIEGKDSSPFSQKQSLTLF
jgi:hypothetical protein